ncbi:PAH-inducible cytochrome P450 monooxygenase PC-PAH 4 [Cubamyces lactineus]|nr:PAH-inducible cytochrome P450 monooxygenase PC-PAH 4 [Cubamyces lactineus]
MISAIPLPALLGLGLISLVVALLRRRKGTSIGDLKGPSSRSILLGHEYDLSRQEEVGDLEFTWLKEYGPTWKVRAPFGHDALMTADPKALQHIFHKSGYGYAKEPSQNHISYIMAGPNIAWVQNADHQRHRKIMNPAFSAAQLRSFLPMFQATVQRLSDKWKTKLSATGPSVLRVDDWISRAALDIIGQAAFDYDYKGLDDDSDSPLAQAYHGIFKEVGYMLPVSTMLFRATWDYIPEPILKLFKYIPAQPFNHLRGVSNLFTKYGREILREKRPEADAEKRTDGKDVLSILIKANESSDPKTRLSDEELLAQMYTLTLAGHETTATTFSYLLYEVARHPEYQARMRQEVLETRARILERGGVEFTLEDLDAMPVCMNAIKETLRVHPIAASLPRVATHDDVLPLAFPATTKSGETVNEVPIRKGQVVYTSLATYNRIPQVWGEDSHEWNPDRFTRLDGGKQTFVGVFANLMTFSAGTRACIGWRFSPSQVDVAHPSSPLNMVIEMQALCTELLGSFQFSLPDGYDPKKPELQRAPSSSNMIAIIRGKPELGTAMRLRVELLE